MQDSVNVDKNNVTKKILLRYIEYTEYQIIENIENSIFSRHFKKIYGLNEIFFW